MLTKVCYEEDLEVREGVKGGRRKEGLSLVGCCSLAQLLSARLLSEAEKLLSDATSAQKVIHIIIIMGSIRFE